MRETFPEQLNAKLTNSEFDNVEDGLNNFRKTICEVADGVLGKKVRTAARNISVKTLCLIDRKKGLYKNYLKDRS